MGRKILTVCPIVFKDTEIGLLNLLNNQIFV